jgi:hypothetical protein
MITVIEKVLDLTFELRVGTVIVRWMTLGMALGVFARGV